MNEKRNIVFLDVDSVLNHSLPGKDIYDGIESRHLVEKDVPIFKDNLAALKHIFDNVKDIGIVWSSDWRIVDDDTWKTPYSNIVWKNPIHWLEKQDWLKDCIIGKTPKKMSSNRFEEIHFWFVQNNNAKKFKDKQQMTVKHYDISNYAIIDDFDSPGMKRYGDHFFKCYYDAGLTFEFAQEIVRYLSVENFDYTELDWSNNG